MTVNYTYDPSLVETVATNLDLRAPNKHAVDKFAQAIETADPGQLFVADLATGVGKTYVAGGLLDYLYAVGVRNVVIVTPGSTIQRKTINNLTPGHPKYLRGLQSRPKVITIDDFAEGTTATALDDPDEFKVFVFTVQSLLKPNTKDNRRAYRPHETVGQSLTDYLRSADDVVVIADEHHVYAGNARQFIKAIQLLDPKIIIGLTATPDPSTKESDIVYRYPLAEAIADVYVKIPVLVARKDGVKDTRTQLSDGLALLDAKASALQAYCDETNREFIQPVFFIVASTIDEANSISETLAGPDMLGSADRVLVITSDEPDTTLAKLDTLEDPTSPIRAVVSVSMLKEGWDVKNIYVIAAVRALESQLLSEQILGRGLRLPFGARTRIGILDTVEVLSHHSMHKLLKDAEVLLTQTLGQRTDEADAVVNQENGESTQTSSIDEVVTETSAGEPVASVVISLPGPAAAPALPTNHGQGSLFGDSEPDDDADFSHQVGIISTLEERMNQSAATQQALTTTIRPQTIDGLRLPWFIPAVATRVEREPFSLTRINTIDVEALGVEFANDEGSSLTRKALTASRDAAGTVAVQIVDRTKEAHIAASQMRLPFDTIESDLTSRLVSTNGVVANATEYRAAAGIAKAFLTGVGVNEETPWHSEHARRATDALVGWLTAKQTTTPTRQVVEVTQVRWPEPDDRIDTKVPTNRNLVTSSRSFTRGQPYTGWVKSVYPNPSFDSWSAEFCLGELMETSDNVVAWTRVTNAVPLRMTYKAGASVRSYVPDFIVLDQQGTFWVVEGKSDTDMTDETVIAKRDAARAWVDAVNSSDSVRPKWAYTLMSESAIKSASNWVQALAGSQTHK